MPDTATVPDAVVDALGMPKHEIVYVGNGPDDGTLAQTKDGNTYIIHGDTVRLYVPAHPTVKLPIETYRPPTGSADLGIPAATPVAPEVALALQWRRRQLEERAAADGIDVNTDIPVVTVPLADASAAALVTDAGPQPDEATQNENPADQPPDEPGNRQPADKVVKKARARQTAERAPKK